MHRFTFQSHKQYKDQIDQHCNTKQYATSFYELGNVVNYEEFHLTMVLL